MRRAMKLAVMGLCMQASAALAAGAPGATELDARTQALAGELRCLVCQNQTLADSHAPLALDLKAKVREQLAAGRSDEEVMTYMTDRYGDFVRYRPPFKASTWLLWLGPAALLALALVAFARLMRRRATQSDAQFEADPQEPTDA